MANGFSSLFGGVPSLLLQTLDGVTAVRARVLKFGSGLTFVDNADGTTTLTASGGGGNVATDTIFDAKGDLAVGTGADTAAKLSVGTDGFVLTADSGEATGLAWAAGGGGAVGTDTIWDTKGDLAVATGANTASKLAAGTNDFLLVAASGEATGLKWRALVAGDIPAIAESGVTSLTTDLAAKTVKATLTAKGSIYVASAASTPAELAVGSNGLILTADSGETTGVKWAAAGSGSVAADAIFDAKGDLAVGTGADTAAKLTAGANDTILMAESGETTGLKWVASQTPSTQAFSDAAAEGTADTYARGDHVHGMPASPSGGAIPTWSYKRTAGSYTPGAGSAYIDLDGTNLAGSLAAAIGDVLEFCLSAFASAACYFDVQMTTSSNYVACSGGSSDQGVVAWTGSRAGGGGGVLYTVVSGDISGGNVAFKLRVNPNGTSPTVFGVSTVPLMFSAKNLKH